MIRLLALLLTAGLLLAPLGAVAGWTPSGQSTGASLGHDGCDPDAPAVPDDGDCCTSGGHCLGLALRPAVATGWRCELPAESRTPGFAPRPPGLSHHLEPPPPRA